MASGRNQRSVALTTATNLFLSVLKRQTTTKYDEDQELAKLNLLSQSAIKNIQNTAALTLTYRATTNGLVDDDIYLAVKEIVSVVQLEVQTYITLGLSQQGETSIYNFLYAQVDLMWTKKQRYLRVKQRQITRIKRILYLWVFLAVFCVSGGAAYVQKLDVTSQTKQKLLMEGGVAVTVAGGLAYAAQAFLNVPVSVITGMLTSLGTLLYQPAKTAATATISTDSILFCLDQVFKKLDNVMSGSVILIGFIAFLFILLYVARDVDNGIDVNNAIQKVKKQIKEIVKHDKTEKPYEVLQIQGTHVDCVEALVRAACM